ncbi:MAG: glutathione peroxidase [Gemmatimonadota bacterium]|nr:glutathione peroxidase [Gemmatimonadota bacterium]
MTVFDFSARDITGADRPLADFRGQVLLIVNVASRCGRTPQYAGLEALHRKYAGRGFAVLGFPCNQFGAQEPGDEAQIAQFCSLNYDVTFPMFAKVDVNGSDAHPLFEHLKAEAPGILGTEGIKWNFTKFLVDRSGRVRKRFGSRDEPEAFEGEVAALVDEPASTT